MVEVQASLKTPERKLPVFSELGHDLIRLTWFQRYWAIALPFLCIVAFPIFAWLRWWPAAIISAAGYTFFSYGSTSHDLVHGNLGLPPWLNNILLMVIELLGLRSGHAYRAAHLHHHARFPHRDDIEGTAAHGSLVAALITAPLHQPRLWFWALRHAQRDRWWIVLEGVACVAMIFAAIFASAMTPIPVIYVGLVIGGSWTFPLITSYLPHDPKGNNKLTQTRRFRGKVAAVVFGQHLYHLEHHLYPFVPRQNWPKLAKRLDPYFDAVGVKSVYFGF